jgi:hypothetical protein
LSQSSLQIHITDSIAKLIAQIAKSLMILILPSFPLHNKYREKTMEVSGDERIVIVVMELFCKAKQREENFNASADAIYVAVLYEHDSHGESVFGFAITEPWFKAVFSVRYLS